MTCDFRTNQECTCNKNECRVSDVVHGMSVYDAARIKAFHAMNVIAVCVAFLSILAVVLLAAESHQKTIDTINQENINHG